MNGCTNSQSDKAPLWDTGCADANVTFLCLPVMYARRVMRNKTRKPIETQQKVGRSALITHVTTAEAKIHASCVKMRDAVIFTNVYSLKTAKNEKQHDGMFKTMKWLAVPLLKT